MTQVLRNAGIGASGHGFRSSFKDWAPQHDVDELLSGFALARARGSATVAAYARDDLLEKRRPVMQRGPTAWLEAHIQRRGRRNSPCPSSRWQSCEILRRPSTFRFELIRGVSRGRLARHRAHCH